MKKAPTGEGWISSGTDPFLAEARTRPEARSDQLKVKTLTTLMIDNSGSMNRKSHYRSSDLANSTQLTVLATLEQELNKWIKRPMKQNAFFMDGGEIAIGTFAGYENSHFGVDVEYEWLTSLSNYSTPFVSAIDLKKVGPISPTKGFTPGFSAIINAIQETRSRKIELEKFGIALEHPPIVFLLTDGQFESDHDRVSMNDARKAIEIAETDKGLSLLFFIVGFGDADSAQCSELAPKSFYPIETGEETLADIMNVFQLVSQSVAMTGGDSYEFIRSRYEAYRKDFKCIACGRHFNFREKSALDPSNCKQCRGS